MTMKAVTLHLSSVCILCIFDQFWFSIISTIIGIPLSAISRSAALRIFFFLRLRSSLAVSKISQTYVTTIHIDPSLDSQIEILEKLLPSGVTNSYLSYLPLWYIRNTDYLSTGILKNIVKCLEFNLCAQRYGGIETIQFRILKYLKHKHALQSLS
jgi:hypothetical protein